ncbi:hypothetical protein EUX98_g7170 [Antrodiella citrinella]|uniref:Uncharacterized protein n=1 Tax=Antrodiella citrinella TaxID=2447956 RepID=A0A4S4MNZ1_9APHY|nr:hypothetical protein EUX98_g7170 [Antrodiella citrinella]
MLFRFRRKETPWEVVGMKRVDPVACYDEIDDDDLDVLRICDLNMRTTFSHEIGGVQDMRIVVHSARHQLMQSVVRHNYNVLLSEGWTITVFRRGKSYKAEVTYTGRPAYVMGSIKSRPPPPFMDVLELCKHDMDSAVLDVQKLSRKVRKTDRGVTVKG